MIVIMLLLIIACSANTTNNTTNPIGGARFSLSFLAPLFPPQALTYFEQILQGVQQPRNPGAAG